MIDVLMGLLVWLAMLWLMWAFVRAMMDWVDEILASILEEILNRK
ncbi:hypothetical protein [Pyrococcus yayanosii]|uniref:Uncharacterized protein n=1 Tax=Pyrococcus yayanosii (strain CH1 / JCM 16557) TaxID=529709 RepID=F8AGD4_PYRYC|nr:hypothetical protein [Pyrococcus yayanosii]AEH25130.1 hypothetical protein PYCH_14600 [Pyrococcus yayanosii CH1]